MRADSLEQKIAQRPKPEELIKEGILEGELFVCVDGGCLRLSGRCADFLGVVADENPMSPT